MIVGLKNVLEIIVENKKWQGLQKDGEIHISLCFRPKVAILVEGKTNIQNF